MSEVTTSTPAPSGLQPGVCVPFEDKLRELGGVVGDEALIRSQWEQLDQAAYLYLWFWVHR